MNAVVIFLIICATTSPTSQGSEVAKRDALSHLTTVTNNLSRKVSSLRGQMDKQEAQVVHQTERMDDLTAQLAQKDEQIDTLTHTMQNNISETLTSLDAFCTANVNQFNSSLMTLESPVAFTAHFTNYTVDGFVNMTSSKYSTMPFDAVPYQVGGDNYDSSSGIFTAPDSGTYVFFIAVTRNNSLVDECLEAVVTKSPGNILKAQVSVCPPAHGAASAMVVIALQPQDTVFAQCSHCSDLLGGTHSTFSGVKVAPTL